MSDKYFFCFVVELPSVKIKIQCFFVQILNRQEKLTKKYSISFKFTNIDVTKYFTLRT